MINVNKISEHQFTVTVSGTTTTTHDVSLAENYYQKLTGGKISKEQLIEESFKFLLKHESNTMILSSFDLTVIQQYFPNYESEIKC